MDAFLWPLHVNIDTHTCRYMCIDTTHTSPPITATTTLYQTCSLLLASTSSRGVRGLQVCTEAYLCEGPGGGQKSLLNVFLSQLPSCFLEAKPLTLNPDFTSSGGSASSRCFPASAFTAGITGMRIYNQLLWSYEWVLGS